MRPLGEISGWVVQRKVEGLWSALYAIAEKPRRRNPYHREGLPVHHEPRSHYGRSLPNFSCQVLKLIMATAGAPFRSSFGVIVRPM